MLLSSWVGCSHVNINLWLHIDPEFRGTGSRREDWECCHPVSTSCFSDTTVHRNRGRLVKMHGLGWGLSAHDIYTLKGKVLTCILCVKKKRRSREARRNSKRRKPTFSEYLLDAKQRVVDFDSQIATQSSLTDGVPRCSLHNSIDRRIQGDRQLLTKCLKLKSRTSKRRLKGTTTQ